MKEFLSYSKINIGLKILNKRSDQYHNIYSQFLEISLFDKLIFQPATQFKLTIEGENISSIPLNQSNLINQAYKILNTYNNSNNQPYKIHLIKKIPTGSGLGGGSSNAATTLKALNNLWKLNISNKNLEALGTKIGADVPFFINGGIQCAEGIGEILTPINSKHIKNFKFILIVPQIHINTTWAYNKLNKHLQHDNKLTKFSPLSNKMIWELFDNDFEQVIHKTYPEIANIKADLIKNGALYASLSGSGSTVFGVFDSHKKATIAIKKFNQYQTFLTTPVVR